MMDMDLLKIIFKKRETNTRKGLNGRAGLIVGSYLYSGSAVITGLACLYTGIDIVRIYTVKEIANVVRSYDPSLIVFPVTYDFFKKEDIEVIKRLLDKEDVFLIGNGLTRRRETLEFIKEFVLFCEKPLVVDADGIYGLKEILDEIKNKDIIVTPHKREFEILFDVEIQDKDLNEVIEIVKEKALEYNLKIVLKGRMDIITDGKEIILVKGGNPYLCKAGSGDVLAGLITGFYALTKDWKASCYSACFINKKASNLCLKKYGPSFTIKDLLESVKEVIKKYYEIFQPWPLSS